MHILTTEELYVLAATLVFLLTIFGWIVANDVKS